MAALDETFWENLLLFIEDRDVVPIVGPEVVTVPDGGREIPLERWLAGQLAGALKLPPEQLPGDAALNDVVSLHARLHRPREELYPRIFSLLRKAALEPPPPLRSLAAIDGFPLFVSLTFDGLLAKALADARRGGGAPPIAYCPSDVRDLEGPVVSLAAPVVFQLLGSCSPSPQYAICDEDVIEFLHAMQAEHRRPKLLFDELRSRHLLLLGLSLDDWLTRFFLRVVRGTPFSENRRHTEVVVDSVAARAKSLVTFLESYSSNTVVVDGLTAGGFVEELARRWEASRPAAAPRAATAESAPATPEGAVFLSYASEDLGVAQQVAQALQAAGIDVWFDKARLTAGDRWELRIRRAIEGCSVFLPLVSRATLAPSNRRSYFWVEWNAACKLIEGMAPCEEFIVPVLVDDTPSSSADLPDAFRAGQQVQLRGGGLPPESVQRLKELVRDFHRRRAA